MREDVSGERLLAVGTAEPDLSSLKLGDDRVSVRPEGLPRHDAGTEGVGERTDLCGNGRRRRHWTKGQSSKKDASTESHMGIPVG